MKSLKHRIKRWIRGWEFRREMRKIEKEGLPESLFSEKPWENPMGKSWDQEEISILPKSDNPFLAMFSDEEMDTLRLIAKHLESECACAPDGLTSLSSLKPEIKECTVLLKSLDSSCVSIISGPEQTPIALASLEDATLLGVDKPGTYTAIVKCDPADDDALLSHSVLCMVAPDQYTLFTHVPDLKNRVRLIERFKSCNPLQQQSIAEYARREAFVSKELPDEDQRTAQRYTIKEADALVLMYEMCKHTLPKNLQYQCEELIHKIRTHSPHSGSTVSDSAVALADILYTCNETNEKKPFLSAKECLEVFRQFRYGDDPWIHKIIKQLRLLNRCDHSGTVFVLVGKPGTGKTSIGKAIAICTHKKFFIINCDNQNACDLAGANKIYADANHGMVQEAFLNYGNNLVLFLDEPDKMVTTEKEGNPFALFGSTWDDRQTFTDTFTKVPVPTNDTIFILALNDLSQVPDYILNRFHENVFILDDYSAETKAEIGKRFIVPKFMKQFHFTEEDVQFTDEGLLAIARSTNDGGARITEQRIKSLFGEVNAVLEDGGAAPVIVDAAYVQRALQGVKNNLSNNDNHFAVGF